MPCEYSKVGGAGNKLSMIVEKEIDVYYYPKKGGLSSWDVCAGEALVKGMGGKVTNK